MATVDEYLAALPDDQRAALQDLRRLIREACPEAVEDLGYGMPRYKYRGRPLVAFAAWKGYLSLYAGHDPITRHAADLAPFRVQASTIHFQPDNRLPDALFTAIIRERMVDVDSEPAARRSKGK